MLLPRTCISTRDREADRKLLKRMTQVETHVEENALVREAHEKAAKKLAADGPASETMGTAGKG